MMSSMIRCARPTCLRNFSQLNLASVGKGFLHIAVQVNGQQTAAIVRTEGNFTAGIGGYGFEALVGVAVGH